MRRLLTISALFALTLALTAAGQPPQPPRSGGPPSAPPPKPTEKLVEKKSDPTDAIIAAALVNDPDVKMAQAKMQLAQAELAKARQAVTLRVVMLKARIEQIKAQLTTAEQQLAIVTAAHKRATVSYSEVLPAREKVETTKAALAIAEAEWKLLAGPAPHSQGAPQSNFRLTLDAQKQGVVLDDIVVEFSGPYRLVYDAPRQPAVKGPIPDRLRAALDKPVKLAEKGKKVTLEEALATFKKEVGLDVPVRPTPSPMPEIVSEGETLPVGAWFQLFLDQGRQSEGLSFYVREYGLLIANRQAAPPDAPTLTEFWKRKPPTKTEPKK